MKRELEIGIRFHGHAECLTRHGRHQGWNSTRDAYGKLKPLWPITLRFMMLYWI